MCYSTGEALAPHTCEYTQQRSGERWTHCEYDVGEDQTCVKGEGNRKQKRKLKEQSQITEGG